MTRKLDESVIESLKQTIQERFGAPLQGKPRETLAESAMCSECGGMMAFEGDTCGSCGKMNHELDEVERPENDNAIPVPLYYEIVDMQTGAVVGKAKNRRSASNSVDRRDNEYGGYRFQARPVYAK